MWFEIQLYDEVQVTAPEGAEVTPIWKERGSFLPMGMSGRDSKDKRKKNKNKRKTKEE